MKVLLLANTDWFLYRFNGELIRSLRRAGAEVVLVGPRGEYSRRFEDEGFRWLHWPIERRRLLPWQELASCWRLRRILQQERPHLVHCFTLKAALYGAAMARAVGVGRIVHSITGLGYLWASNHLRARCLRHLLGIFARRLFPAAEMIFLNRDDHQELAGRGWVGPDRGTVIGGSGVDVEIFGLQPWPDVSPPLAVLPARLLRSKGVETFVQAAGILQRQGVDGRFALVGPLDDDHPDGISESQLRRWCADHGVERWGFRRDMIEVYRQASVVCLPSFYREGVPTVLLEAAACGRPVITTDMPGCRDAVAPGRSGRLVPAKDAEALATALADLLADATACRAMGLAGRRRVIEHFSTQRVVEATFGIYRRLGLDFEPVSSPGEPLRQPKAFEPKPRVREDAQP